MMQWGRDTSWRSIPSSRTTWTSHSYPSSTCLMASSLTRVAGNLIRVPNGSKILKVSTGMLVPLLRRQQTHDCRMSFPITFNRFVINQLSFPIWLVTNGEFLSIFNSLFLYSGKFHCENESDNEQEEAGGK
jgi:hypothetical protein